MASIFMNKGLETTTAIIGENNKNRLAEKKHSTGSSIFMSQIGQST